MDIVVSVDTGVAHLAGAMGKPVWILLPFIPIDWRWMLDRPDSPWYPTLRLFRQRVRGNWEEVFGRIAKFGRIAHGVGHHAAVLAGARGRDRDDVFTAAKGDLGESDLFRVDERLATWQGKVAGLLPIAAALGVASIRRE